MIRTHESLVREYWDRIKSDNPDLSLDRLRDMCDIPGKLLKKLMREGDCDGVYYMNLGTVSIRKPKVKKELHLLEKEWEQQVTTEEEYLVKKERLEKILIELEKQINPRSNVERKKYKDFILVDDVEKDDTE